jgi:hypothetical protein
MLQKKRDAVASTDHTESILAANTAIMEIYQSFQGE